MAETVDRCEEIVRSGVVGQHLAVNAAKLVAMQEDERLREIAATCPLVSADGQAVVWATKFLGDPVPERVAGIDLMTALFERAENRGYRVFILGAREDVLERAVSRLRSRYRRLQVAGTRDGYFTDAENEDVCDEIRAARPDILFVAMSTPRKEYWLAEHGPGLGVPLLMGVGGAVDVIAGVVRRAPRWAQRLGLEWLFRLFQEPQRLWKRYLMTNARFVWLVVRERARVARQRV